MYWILEDNKKMAFRELIKLPYEHQLIIAFVLSKRLLLFGEDFILERMTSFYTLPVLLSKYIHLPDIIDSAYIDYDNSMRIFSTNRFELPAYIAIAPKLGKKGYRIGYFLRSGKLTKTNITSKILKDEFYGLSVDFGLVFLYKRAKKGDKKVSIIPLIMGSKQDVVKFLQPNYKIALSRFKLFPKITPKSKFITVNNLNFKYIETAEEFKDSFKVTKNLFVFSDNGLSVIKPKTEVVVNQIVDFLVNEYYEAEGFIVDNDGELEEVRYNVPEHVLENGIEDAYIKFTVYKFGDFIIKKVPVTVGFGTYKKCAICGKLTNKIIAEVCTSHYSWLLKVVDSHIENTFELPVECFRETKSRVKHYEVEFKKDKIVFTKNVEGYRGAQLKLPFDYVNEF
jgi:hypothetical protein